MTTGMSTKGTVGFLLWRRQSGSGEHTIKKAAGTRRLPWECEGVDQMKGVGEGCEGVMGDMREKEEEAGDRHLGRMTTAFRNAFVQTRKRHFTRQIRSSPQSQYLHFSELRVPL